MDNALIPDSIHPPFGHYAHGIVIPAGARVVLTSGQLGISKDGAIPDSVEEQAWICLENIRAILKSAHMAPEHIVQLRTFVTDRAFFKPYMEIRDRFLQNRNVASTLMIVSGFSREEFKIEIEAVAAVLPEQHEKSA